MKPLVKKHSILKSTIIVTAIIVVAKFIGFAREAIIAAYYGATWMTDAFFFANNMPSMLFPAVCNSLSTAFVTLYVSHSVEKGEKEGDRFASRMLIVTLGIAIILSVIAFIVTPWTVPLFAPGFEGEQRLLAIKLTRMTMGAFVLTMAQYMLSAILNSKKMFYGSRIAGLIYNIVIIIITIMLGSGQSTVALTLTVVIGSLFQLLFLIALTWRNFKFTLWVNPFHNESKVLIRLALPILLGNSIVQINNIVDRFLASYFENGAISALSYSASLNSMVIGIFITSLSTVLYPSLSENVANNNMEKFHRNLLQSIIILPIFIFPISIITILYAKDIVSIVFERGNFDNSATMITATALGCYAGMYPFIAINEVITRGFYALKDTKTPMINGAVAVIANSILSVILSKWIGFGGIALGTTISTGVASMILWLSIKRKLTNLKLDSLYGSLVKMLISSVILVAVLIVINQLLSTVSPLLGFIIATLVGFSVYFGILFLLKCKEVIFMLSKIRAIIGNDK